MWVTGSSGRALGFVGFIRVDLVHSDASCAWSRSFGLIRARLGIVVFIPARHGSHRIHSGALWGSLGLFASALWSLGSFGFVEI